jgi:hypothetical protein
LEAGGDDCLAASSPGIIKIDRRAAPLRGTRRFVPASNKFV